MPPEVGNIAIAIITVRQPHVSQEFRHMPEDFMSASLPKFGRYKVWIVSCLKDDLGSGSVVSLLTAWLWGGIACGGALAPSPCMLDLDKTTSRLMLVMGNRSCRCLKEQWMLGNLW